MVCINKYDVYDNRTDFPIIIDGTAKECARALGITKRSFYNIVVKSKKDKSVFWHITIERRNRNGK